MSHLRPVVVTLLHTPPTGSRPHVGPSRVGSKMMRCRPADKRHAMLLSDKRIMRENVSEACNDWRGCQASRQTEKRSRGNGRPKDRSVTRAEEPAFSQTHQGRTVEEARLPTSNRNSYVCPSAPLCLSLHLCQSSSLCSPWYMYSRLIEPISWSNRPPNVP